MEFKNNKAGFLNIHIIYIIPRSGVTPLEQMQDCLQQLDQECNLKKIDLTNIIKQSVFIEANNMNDYYEKTDLFQLTINKFYKSVTPTTSFIAEAPADEKKVSLEVYFVDKSSNEIVITHKSVDDISYTVINNPYHKEIYAAGLTTKYLNNIFEQAKGSFTQMQKILDNEKLSYSDVVRQWNFIDKIADKTEYDPDRQNYQIFNDVRSLFYGTSNFVNGYPSATGIGTFTGGVTIDFIAVSSSGHLSIHPLNNPEQIDAYKYSDNVLVGKGIDETTRKTTPKFERGKLLKAKDYTRIYISGTAAVVGETTAHIDDVENQTLTTIENINKLLSPENLLKFGVHNKSKKLSFSYLRTYIKYPSDVESVKDLCEQHFSSDNFQYLVSDICRDDLLVEIEGCLEF